MVGQLGAVEEATAHWTHGSTSWKNCKLTRPTILATGTLWSILLMLLIICSHIILTLSRIAYLFVERIVEHKMELHVILHCFHSGT